jgi:F0F1-type ATP synthase membrane subunit b/b'
LAAAHESVRQMIQTVRAEATKETDEMLAKAKAEATKERGEATAAVDRAKEEALVALREAALGLASNATAKFLERPISADQLRPYLQENAK